MSPDVPVVIDAHNHLTKYPNRVRGLDSAESDDRLDPQDMQDGWVAAMDAAGVSRSILFDRQNAEILTFVQNCPGRFSALAGIDPREGREAITEAETYLAAGFLGIKCSPSAEAARDRRGYELDDPRCWEFYGYCAQNDIPILFHTGMIYLHPEDPSWHHVDQGRPLRLDRVARHFPALRIVLGHVGRPFWDEALALANHPNVWVDLTWSQLPMHFYRRSVEVAVYGFGPERVVFGSDSTASMPGRSAELLQATRELLHEFDVSPEDEAKILGGNAARLFGIS